MSNREDNLGWRFYLFVLGTIVAMIVGPSFMGSLPIPIYPLWLRSVLWLPIMAAGLWIVLFSHRLWLQIPFLIAFGILVIYTIIGIILGDIEPIMPSRPPLI